MLNSWLRTQDRQDCKLSSLVNPSQLCRCAGAAEEGSLLGFCGKQECPLPRSESTGCCKTCSCLCLIPRGQALQIPLSNPCELRQWVSLRSVSLKMLGELDVHPGLSFSHCRNHKPRDPLGVVLCHLGKGQCDQSVVVPYLSTVVLSLCGPGDATN